MVNVHIAIHGSANVGFFGFFLTVPAALLNHIIMLFCTVDSVLCDHSLLPAPDSDYI